MSAIGRNCLLACAELASALAAPDRPPCMLGQRLPHAAAAQLCPLGPEAPTLHAVPLCTSIPEASGRPARHERLHSARLVHAWAVRVLQPHSPATASRLRAGRHHAPLARTRARLRCLHPLPAPAAFIFPLAKSKWRLSPSNNTVVTWNATAFMNSRASTSGMWYFFAGVNNIHGGVTRSCQASARIA